MLTPIHRALGLPAGKFDRELVEAAIDSRVQESSDLDWKQTLYRTENPNWRDEAAKDIAAMANSGGGLIVFGIKEGAGNTASEATPFEWNELAERQLLQTAYTRIDPPVLGLSFHPIIWDNNHSIVGLRIPDSPDSPHFARKSETDFQAPRRNGPHTVPMTGREIEQGFRQRFQLETDRENELIEVFERAADGINPDSGVHLVAVAIPNEPFRGQLSSAGSLEIVDNANFEQLVPPEQTGNFDEVVGRPKRGLRRWVFVRDIPNGAWKKQVHESGILQTFYQLSLLTDHEDAAFAYPVGEPNHCRSIDIERKIADFFATLRKLAQKLEANGGYRVRVGLVRGNAGPIFIRASRLPSESLLPIEHALPIYYPSIISTDFDPQEPVSEWLRTVSDVALDLINQGGVQNLRVISEPSD